MSDYKLPLDNQLHIGCLGDRGPASRSISYWLIDVTDGEV
jgi:hypothetical protein